MKGLFIQLIKQRCGKNLDSAKLLVRGYVSCLEFTEDSYNGSYTQKEEYGGNHRQFVESGCVLSAMVFHLDCLPPEREPIISRRGISIEQDFDRKVD